MALPNFFGTNDILGAMITPAVLISASGTLVLSTSNRLGRVVDRIRKLTEQAEELPDESATEEIVEKRALIADQIGWLTRRLRLLQTAIIFFYASIGMLVAFQMFAGRLSQPMLHLVGLWQQFQQADIAVRRLGDVMNAPAEPYSLLPSRETKGDGWIEISQSDRGSS